MAIAVNTLKAKEVHPSNPHRQNNFLCLLVASLEMRQNKLFVHFDFGHLLSLLGNLLLNLLGGASIADRKQFHLLQ